MQTAERTTSCLHSADAAQMVREAVAVGADRAQLVTALLAGLGSV